jgi:hypothetical protein
VKLVPVKSSNVKEVGHDPATNTLTVVFIGGTRYDYPDVTVEQHKALMAARSIGQHLYQHHIKGNTAFKKAA